MGKRVMVVDDSRVVQLQIQKLLEGSDYEIAAYCRDGETAINQYSEVMPDVVTMDIIMPGIDGLETARVILQDHPGAKIIMVSSLAYEDTINESNSIGVKGFVYKPFDRAHLIEMLDQACQEEA